MTDDTDRFPYSPDRPIETRDEDLLGRSDFAASIAKAIQNWKGEDSLVIGLFGPWGCGKTSLINMVTDTFNKPDKDRIVHFNPWALSGQEDLVASLFTEMAQKLAIGDNEQRDKLLADLLQFGGCLVFAASSFPLAASAGWVDPSIAATIRTSSGAVGKMIRYLQTLSQRKRDKSVNDTLNTLKARLKEGFKSLNQPILIVIDDIDRLDTKEMSLLFRLIKVNLDFPNLIFLLAFQRDTVERALSRYGSPGEPYFEGKDYLQKIIQVGFDVPRAQRTKLEKVFFNRLDKAIGKDTLNSQLFERERWERVYHRGIKQYTLNLRDVYRYVSSVKFHTGVFTVQNKLEVNVVDLLSVETLRLFEPNVYNSLPLSKDILTGGTENLLEERVEQITSRIKDILSYASNVEAVSALLAELFPRARKALDESFWDSSGAPDWLTKLRIAHPLNYGRYFTFTISEQDITLAEFALTLEKLDDPKKFKSAISNLEERGLLHAFLDRISAQTDAVPQERYQNLLLAFFDLADNLRDKGVRSEIWYDTGFANRMFQLAYDLLKTEPDEGRRMKLLTSAIGETSGLYIPLQIVGHESLRHADLPAHSKALLSELNLGEIKQLCVHKIENLSENGYLAHIDFMRDVLGKWSNWGSAKAAKDWVQSVIDDCEHLKALVVGFLRSSIATGAGPTTTEYFMRLEEIEEYVTIPDIEERLPAAKATDLTDIQKIAIATFEKAVKMRSEKPNRYREWSKIGHEW